ncbi:replication/maintenance protein RepL (plasmid) [Tenacibaculum maritimum]|nr:replication/maintenance protein RepL [Tenacibaculum maritimum]MDB0613666.1 replication/maintenance protein RepL [Tenacibaculum maritimum]
MNKKNISQVQSVETYDENGELISSDNKVTSFSYETEPEYIKLYLSDIGKLNGLSPASNKVLLELIKSMSYNNVIPVYMPIKKMIANKLGITTHSVEKAVKTFYKKGLFIRAARGVYIADPNLFGKGKWTDIKKLRLVVEYDKDGTKKLSSNLSEELQLRLGL